ncbi:MAG: Minf_1886 family protein [Planctomycetota bacterium]
MHPKPNWNEIRERAGNFPPQAYQFVREGLGHTARLVHGERGESHLEATGTDEGGRHVSGQQLCLGLKDYALKQYGLLARTVLTHWGIQRTEDFGRVVFAMVEAGWMRKTQEDTPEDFEGVFDFDDVFGTLRPGESRLS